MVTRLDDVPRLLGFSNYPWNKVARTDHYRHTGLRYGSTPVHNDILGHWLTLLDAGSILLIDQPLCTHIVNEGGRNLTNRESRARLSLLDALEETYSALEARPAKRNRFSHHYWDFALRVAGLGDGAHDARRARRVQPPPAAAFAEDGLGRLHTDPTAARSRIGDPHHPPRPRLTEGA